MLIKMVELLLRYGPPALDMVNAISKVRKKESIGTCFACKEAIFSDNDSLDFRALDKIITGKELSCDNESCKAFVEIQNLGKRNDYFK